MFPWLIASPQELLFIIEVLLFIIAETKKRRNSGTQETS